MTNLSIDSIIKSNQNLNEIHNKILLIIKNRKHKDFISPSESKQIDYSIIDLLSLIVEEIYKITDIKVRVDLIEEITSLRYYYSLNVPKSNLYEEFAGSEKISNLLDDLSLIENEKQAENLILEAKKELKEVYVGFKD